MEIEDVPVPCTDDLGVDDPREPDDLEHLEFTGEGTFEGEPVDIWSLSLEHVVVYEEGTMER